MRHRAKGGVRSQHLKFGRLLNLPLWLMGRLRLRSGQDFLKPRIVPKRVVFPTCPQVGKGDAVIGVVHAYKHCAALARQRTRACHSWLRDDGGRYRHLQFLAECSEARVIFVIENEGRD